MSYSPIILVNEVLQEKIRQIHMTFFSFLIVVATQYKIHETENPNYIIMQIMVILIQHFPSQHPSIINCMIYHIDAN